MINIICATDRNDVIGSSDQDSLLWHSPLDLQHFRDLTWGSNVFVGRRTWESLPKHVKKCDGRDWYVITSKVSKESFEGTSNDLWSEDVYPVEGVKACENFHQAMHDFQQQDKHAFVAGGSSVYKQALQGNYVDRCFLTRLNISVQGDVKWPGLNMSKDWKKVRDRNFFCNGLDKNISFEEWVK